MEFYPKYATDFESQTLAQDKDGNFLLSASYRDKTKGSCRSIVVKINSSGEQIAEQTFEDIKINGLLLLNNGNMLMYGTHYQVYSKMLIISKGSFVIVNSNFEKIASDEMGIFDLPDYNLPSLVATAQPTSSEFNTGIQLSDGRIVLAGRVFMPDKTSPDEILLSPRYNQPYVLFMNKMEPLERNKNK